MKKCYRDLQPDEAVQPGDERLNRDGAEWVTVERVWIGQLVPEDLMGCFRRPVDLPTLQRVTPEAMAELEGRGAWVILFQHKESQWNRYTKAAYSIFGRSWFSESGKEINPLDFCWFIDLSAIPEVQQ